MSFNSVVWLVQGLPNSSPHSNTNTVECNSTAFVIVFALISRQASRGLQNSCEALAIRPRCRCFQPMSRLRCPCGDVQNFFALRVFHFFVSFQQFVGEDG